LAFVLGLYSLYYQDHLNGIWDRYLWAGGAQPSMPPPVPVPPPVA
jgi:hypothetical protein